MINPLTREQVRRAIKHTGPERVPVMFHFWLHTENFPGREAEINSVLNSYPCDAELIIPVLPGYDESPFKDIPEYVWIRDAKRIPNAAHDARCIMPSWDGLDKIISEFPNPDMLEIYHKAAERIKSLNPGTYRLGHFWFTLYERLWSFRGMENALVDFFENPREVEALFGALTGFYIGMIKNFARIGCDGVYVTDDLGTQAGMMFSPEIFRRFFKPYYKKMIDAAHGLGMEFWLHSCGNIREIIGDLVEIGLDVLHPIQKYAMDEKKVAAEWGGKLCVFSGFDLQQILPFETPENVRREVRFLIETFNRADGGLMLTAGNEITGDVPLENIRALFNEAFKIR